MNQPLQTVEAASIANQALVTLDPETYAAAVYEPFSARLQTAIANAEGVSYNIQTKEGMAVAKEHRAILRTIRIDADKERAARKAPITAIGKLLESKYTELENAVTPYEDKFHADIKTEEDRIETEKAAKLKAEEDAKAAIQANIDAIKNKPLDVMNKSVAEIEEAIAELSPLIPTPAEYGERFIEAEYALKATLDTLNSILSGKKAQEQLDAQNKAAAEAAQAASKEQARIDAIKAKIQLIKNYIMDGAECETSQQVSHITEKVSALIIDPIEYQEFTDSAIEAQKTVINGLARQESALFNIEAAEAKIIADANAAVLEKVRLADLVKEQVNPSTSLQNVLEVAAPIEIQQVFSPETMVMHFKGVEPSVNDLVNAVAKAFGADTMMAHRWLINADFTKYQQAA